MVRKSQTSSQSRRTIDHDEIRRWAEERDGVPATIGGTERSGESAGMLRIDFPEHGRPEALKPVDWDDFFEKFEDARLAFVYDDDPDSRFCKFVRRTEEDEEPMAANA